MKTHKPFQNNFRFVSNPQKFNLISYQIKLGTSTIRFQTLAKKRIKCEEILISIITNLTKNSHLKTSQFFKIQNQIVLLKTPLNFWQMKALIIQSINDISRKSSFQNWVVKRSANLANLVFINSKTNLNLET